MGFVFFDAARYAAPGRFGFHESWKIGRGLLNN